ncbi:sigma-70 family RNA polymerase sigma factor [Streptomyces sp. NPDC048172]|uniref:sigma-70 family RNA polymerase sigma factor n=1 Tax=Streptomyces sp. NPDC048172 TaxID=3365505 RepID=UPI003719B8AB
MLPSGTSGPSGTNGLNGPDSPGSPGSPGSQPDDSSDAALTAAIRTGPPEASQAALDELYRRHRPAVLTYARTCCRDAHTAEDLASEAFVRTLQALRSGGGPTEAWRPYLLTTVRRTAAAWYDTARRTELAPDFERWLSDTTDPDAESGEERMLRLEDEQLVLRAFRTLPERWQTALWHSTVEEEPAPRTAALLGISASGLASLTARAREGLREAYLTAHADHVQTSPYASEECRRYTSLLAASVRRTGRRTNRDLERHLSACPECHRARLELTRLNTGLRTVLPAAVLLWAGSAYLTKATAAATGAATATATATATGTATGIAASTKIAGAVGASVLALAIGGFALYPDGDDTDRAAPGPTPRAGTAAPKDTASPSPTPSKENRKKPTRKPDRTTHRPPAWSPAADARTRLRVASTGRCMDIAASAGAQPREAACTGGRSQQWELLVDRPAQEARIRNRATGMCLVHTGAETDGSPVRQQRACDSSSRSARWTYYKGGENNTNDGTIVFAQKGSGLYFLGLDDWNEAANGRPHAATIGTTANYYNTKSLRFTHDGKLF